MNYLMTPGDWTAIGGIIVVLSFLWKLLRPIGNGIWNLIEAWKEIVPGFSKLTSEVISIF